MESKLEKLRQSGQTQVDEQRLHVLDAAEKLFLQKGLENTHMTDIAAQAGITRMTLYRYYPNRDSIAVEIANRLLKRMDAVNDVRPADEIVGEDQLIEFVKQYAQAMIQNFYELRDSYRFFGMFDQLYSDCYPSEEFAALYKQYLLDCHLNKFSGRRILTEYPQGKQIIMALDCVMSFLQKMASRGELLSGEQEIPLDDMLHMFGEMMKGYLDGLADKTLIQCLKE